MFLTECGSSETSMGVFVIFRFSEDKSRQEPGIETLYINSSLSKPRGETFSRVIAKALISQCRPSPLGASMSTTSLLQRPPNQIMIYDFGNKLASRSDTPTQNVRISSRPRSGSWDGFMHKILGFASFAFGAPLILHLSQEARKISLEKYTLCFVTAANFSDRVIVV
jgi:hypothetical protein